MPLLVRLLVCIVLSAGTYGLLHAYYVTPDEVVELAPETLPPNGRPIVIHADGRWTYVVPGQRIPRWSKRCWGGCVAVLLVWTFRTPSIWRRRSGLRTAN